MGRRFGVEEGLEGKMLAFVLPFLGLQQCAPELCTGAAQPKCPTSRGIVSKPAIGGQYENVYFRNAAPHPAEISRVGADGVEVSYGVLPSNMRRAMTTFHGDVWKARAVTTGADNGRLLMEHQIGAVKIQACNCPQPAFNDCSKSPTLRDAGVVSDPVVFENEAREPVDLFYWNGTNAGEFANMGHGPSPTRREPPRPSRPNPLPHGHSPAPQARARSSSAGMRWAACSPTTASPCSRRRATRSACAPPPTAGCSWRIPSTTS